MRARSRRLSTHHLAERRQPDRGGRQHHRGDGIERQAAEPGRAHQDGEQDLAHDVGRHDAERDPVVGARNAVLHVGERVGRQRDAGDVERDDGVVIEHAACSSHTRPAHSTATAIAMPTASQRLRVM